MPRRLILLNVVFLLTALSAAGYTVLQLREPEPKPIPVRVRPAAEPAPQQPVPTAPSVGGAVAYQTVASRNLFSPTRSEAPAGAAGLRTTAMLPKPNLHGVVLIPGAPIAYLEDPATRRVAAYRLGDAIAGGTVQAIAADHVTLSRPEGSVDVRLRDPSKPRPQAPAVTGPGQPAASFQPGTPAQPPVFPQPPGLVQTGPTATPSGPLIEQPGPPAPFIPGRRPLPPNLLRRLPPAAPSDAPQQ